MTRLHVKLLAAAADSFPPVQHDRPAAVIIRAARPKVVYYVAVIISPALGRQGRRAGEQRRFGIVNDPSTWSPATGMPVACKSRAKGARQLPPGRAPSDSEARQLARHSPAATRTTGGRAGAGRRAGMEAMGYGWARGRPHETRALQYGWGEGGTKARAAAAAAPIDGSMASREGQARGTLPPPRPAPWAPRRNPLSPLPSSPSPDTEQQCRGERRVPILLPCHSISLAAAASRSPRRSLRAKELMLANTLLYSSLSPCIFVYDL
jgi:hypothetical protein